MTGNIKGAYPVKLLYKPYWAVQQHFMRNFHREIIFQRHNANNLLIHLPYFKIYKCPDDFPKPPAEIGHHPYFLEYSFFQRKSVKGITEISYEIGKKPNFKDFPVFPIPDMLVQAHDRQKAKETILNLLNALSNDYFFSYQSNQSWFIPLGENSDYHPQYGQEGYFHEYEMEIKDIEPVENYQFIDPTILLERDEIGTPINTKLSTLIDLYLKIPDTSLQASYLECCAVLSKAQKLQDYDLSAAFLFLVSSLEGLLQIEHENDSIKNCKTCEQPIYKVSQKFKDFLDKYCYEVSNADKNKLYGLRSSIVHKGKLLAYGNSSKMFIENQQDLDLKYQTSKEAIQFSKMLDVAKTCFRVFLKRTLSIKTA